MSSIKVNGVWKDFDKVYTKVNGVWKPVDKVYTKINGAWKEGYSSEVVLYEPGMYLQIVRTSGYEYGNVITNEYYQLENLSSEGYQHATTSKEHSTKNIKNVYIDWEVSEPTYYIRDKIKIYIFTGIETIEPTINEHSFARTITDLSTISKSPTTEVEVRVVLDGRASLKIYKIWGEE